MNDLNDYYKVLGLPENSSLAEVRQAYKELVQVWNPERFSHDPQLQLRAKSTLAEIDEAFDQIVKAMSVKEETQTGLNVTTTPAPRQLCQEEEIDHEKSEKQVLNWGDVETKAQPKSMMDTYFPSKSFRGCIWILLIIFARALFTMYGASFRTLSPPNTSRNESDSNSPVVLGVPIDNGAWTTYVSDKGEYSCLMPGVVSTRVQHLDTEAGKVEQHITSCERVGESFTIECEDYPPGVVFSGTELERADTAIKNYVGDHKFQLQYNKPALCGKHSGKEYRYDDVAAHATVTVRVFVIKDRAIAMIFIGTIGHVNIENGKRYLESLQIIDSK